MALAAFSKITGDTLFRLNKIAWLEPLIIGQDGIEVLLDLQKKEKSFYFEIKNQKQNRTVLYSQGELQKLEQPSFSKNSKVNLDEIKARCHSQSVQARSFYERFQMAGLSYGPYFHTIKRLWYNKREALAKLSLSENYHHEINNYTMHPGLVDGILQTISAIVSHKSTLLLPFAVEEIEILNPLPIEGYAHAQKVGKDSYDLKYCDRQGKVSIEFHRVAIRPLKDRLTQFFYTPAWKAEPCTRSQVVPVESNDKKTDILIVYPQSGARLANDLKRAHSRDAVYLFEMGLENKSRSKNHIVFNYKDASAWEKMLRNAQQPGCIYFLGGIQNKEIQTGDLNDLEQSQDQGVFALFRLIKAVSKGKYTAFPLSIKIIANQVHQMAPQVTTNPYAASLFGFTKSLAKEYPKLEISILDVDLKPDSTEQERDNIVKHIISEPANKAGDEVLIRGNQRYIRELRPAQLTWVKKQVFRKKGVYLILGGTGGIGLELSRYLAGKFQARLVLLGRSELNLSQKKKIDRIESSGGEVLYCRVDTTDPTSLENAVNTAKKRFGVINGVFHSAMVLKDRTLERMDEDTLYQVLEPKVKGSVLLCNAIEQEALDFMLFFSSTQSFTGNEGQANYAAASSFEDIFVRYIAEKKHYPVRIINWSFWGGVGAVATQEYNHRMTKLGFLSIEPTEGMQTINRVLSYPVKQLLLYKAKGRALEQIAINRVHPQKWYPPTIPSLVDHVYQGANDFLSQEKNSTGIKEVYEFQDGQRQALKVMHCLLLEVFMNVGVFRQAGEHYKKSELREVLNIIPKYNRLFNALLEILVKAGFISLTEDRLTSSEQIGSQALKNELAALEVNKESLVQRFTELKAHFDLLETCLNSLPAVLSGNRDYQEVMFPEGDFSLVENIYHGNKNSDYFNTLVAKIVRTYIEHRLENDPQATIRILEVGAGTGGTSRFVLNAIDAYSNHVHFTFTDISPAFTEYEGEKWKANYSFLISKVLNIEKSPLDQGFEANCYDLVFASNVLHATQRIENTLNQIKILLKTNGLLILNEATNLQDFATLTFGLTDGWWLFKDRENRIPGSPLLRVTTWKTLLEITGFERIRMLGRTINDSSGSDNYFC
jgi:polyketide synthase PksN